MVTLRQMLPRPGPEPASVGDAPLEDLREQRSVVLDSVTVNCVTYVAYVSPISRILLHFEIHMCKEAILRVSLPARGYWVRVGMEQRPFEVHNAQRP